MTREKVAKTLAQKLYKEGLTSDVIAKQCKVSQRTVQRWIKEFTSVTISITPPTKEFLGISGNEDIAVLSPDVATVDLDKINVDMGIEMISLVRSSLNAIAQILSDPGARTGDKLKAVQMVSAWAGLGSVPQSHDDTLNVVSKITGYFGLEVNRDIEGQSQLIPVHIMRSRRKQQKEEEEARKQALVEKDEYNSELAGLFQDTGKLPDKLDEKFDYKNVLDYLIDDENVSQFMEVLQERNISIDEEKLSEILGT